MQVAVLLKVMAKQISRQQILKAKNEQYRVMGVFLYPWLLRIAEKYKSEGISPTDTFVLHSYYQDLKDKEIALIMAMTLKYKEGDDLMYTISQLKDLLGEHPYQTLVDRQFIHWHKNEDNPFAKKRLICFEKYMNYIYNLYKAKEWKPLMQIVEEMKYPVNVCLDMLFKGLPIENRGRRIMNTSIILATSEGFGENLWDNECLKVFALPEFPDMNKFVTTFYPPYNRPTYVVDGQDFVEFVGFLNTEDAYFAFLAYEKLWKAHPGQMEASIDRWLRNIGEKGIKKGGQRIRRDMSAYGVKLIMKKSVPPEDW